MSKDLAGAVDLLCFTLYIYEQITIHKKSALIASLYISLLNLFLERILRNDLKEWLFSEAVF